MNQDIISSALLKNLKVEVYSQGESVYSSGDVSNGKLYFLLEGEITVRVDGFSEGYTTVIEKGKFFGEIAVINKYPRNETATVRSGFARVIALRGIDFTHAIMLNKFILKKLLESSNNRFNAAINYYLFRKVSIDQFDFEDSAAESTRNKIREMLNQIYNLNSFFYRKESIIYKEIDLCRGNFYLVESGQVTTYRRMNDKSDYLVIIVHEEGDIFGEQAFFNSDIRKEKALATSTTVRLREIHSETFEKLLNLHSEYFLYFIQMILWKVFVVESKIGEIERRS